MADPVLPPPPTPRQARVLQEEMARQVVLVDRPEFPRLVAGVDVHYFSEDRVAKAVAVVMELPGLETLDRAQASLPVNYAYRPGYLSFREAPAALAALELLKVRPDVVLCDGQGRAHPRFLGLASHLGVLAQMPTVGVAKSRLVGEYQEPQPLRGDWSPLIYRDEVVGAVLCTQDGVRPLFVSPGHLVSLATSIKLTLDTTTSYRQPEPLRLAHHLASEE